MDDLRKHTTKDGSLSLYSLNYKEGFHDTDGALKESISKLRANKLLNGWRGQPKADSEQLVETVMSFEKFVKSNIDNLAECEINPLIVRPSGKGVVAADALIMMKEK